MLFDVTVQRTEYREHTFRVEALDRGSAHFVALEAANDHNFLDSPVNHADEDVTTIVEVKKPKAD